MKKVIVIGAGPAGLTAAYEILNRTDSCQVLVLEEKNQIGGLAKNGRLPRLSNGLGRTSFSYGE